jgi:hypothetical protein
MTRHNDLNMVDWQTVRYDPNYEEPLDQEIIPLCDALNAAGFVTIASCCGHGHDRPRVWFEHCTDERIEKLARFVMVREQIDYYPFASRFKKEIRMDGYLWSLEISLNNVYADTPVEDSLKHAVEAIGCVTQAVREWRKPN